MKKIKLLVFILLANVVAARAQTPGLEVEFQQQTIGWGFGTGLNVSSCMVKGMKTLVTDSLTDRFFSVSPGVGVEAMVYVDYHIARQWSVQLCVRPAVERVAVEEWQPSAVSSSSPHNNGHLTTLSVAIVLPIVYHTHIGAKPLDLALAPYSHFVALSHTDNGIGNPYSRVAATNQRSGMDQLALSDFHSGIALEVQMPLHNNWNIRLTAMQGLTNILNLANNNSSRVNPQKIVITLCRGME